MPAYKAPKGLNQSVVTKISELKKEPEWTREFRRKSLDVFLAKRMPTWGPNLSAIDFSDFSYYVRPKTIDATTWEQVDPEIERVFANLGIPEAEREVLGGVHTQFESDVVYGSLLEELKNQGVIFCSIDEAVKNHSELVRQYFGTIIPTHDNKFSALNGAFFSGGSFVYVPKNVKIEKPLQTYFRINTRKSGQFERTLIIAEEGSAVHYIEGCTAPNYSSANLHAAVVEIIVKEGASVRYTTIQNWSKNVYNLVTKRAHVYKNAQMIWTDVNLGSKVTMKYPSCYLLEEGASGSLLSLAVSNTGQTIDSGGKMFHLASDTKSSILSKTMALGGSRNSFRGMVSIAKKAQNITSKVSCRALLFDDGSESDTYPTITCNNETAAIEHEAYVSQLSADQIFYLQSRGLSEAAATSMLSLGFLAPILKDIPLEYTVELEGLMEMVMEDYYDKS